MTSVYLVVSSWSLIGQIAMPNVSLQAASVDKTNGKTEGSHKPVWTTRRYTPLVKEVSVSLHLEAGLGLDELNERSGEVCLANQPFFNSLFYFSCLSDRAPPRV
jgi:hypothetical protein